MASSNAENSTTLISVKIAETDFLQSVPKNVLMKYSEVFGRMFQREEWLVSAVTSSTSLSLSLSKAGAKRYLAFVFRH